jgi:hypothetical protein
MRCSTLMRQQGGFGGHEELEDRCICLLLAASVDAILIHDSHLDLKEIPTTPAFIAAC